jgi:hypothetical protein
MTPRKLAAMMKGPGSANGEKNFVVHINLTHWLGTQNVRPGFQHQASVESELR